MSRTTLDLWVGLFVALGFAALVFLAVKVGSYTDAPGGATYTVEAAFDNIGGLKTRAPVKSAGVVVGRVGGIHFDSQSYRAIVRLDLQRRYEFPVDTSASILTSGLLGEQYIGLDPGADSEILEDGDKLQITQSAVVLEKLIGQFLFNKAAETPTHGASAQ
ncbi:MAG: outer membrane lipid asymmetry maintenance protein MlaD [Azoarcus sp.]|jgi:phospholipid/cholesterol/gamma-HCH transport system substrate-binding protein|nr:outer membrane lipid asymmetry maintenance protein MlaD [Azoarcus sp.]